MGSRVLVGILLLLAVAALSFAVIGWNTTDTGVKMSGHVHSAMLLGIFFSLAVGIGLMALVFFSSRKGFDDEASRPQRRPPPSGEA
jgi:hypothetical protein